MLNILIPVDGSPHAMRAVHHALFLVAAGLKARFVVANVQATANLYELVVAHDPTVLQQVNEAAGHDLMRAAVHMLQAANLQVVQEVVTGDPAQMLVDVIERQACDVVISPVPVTLVKPLPEPEET